MQKVSTVSVFFLICSLTVSRTFDVVSGLRDARKGSSNDDTTDVFDRFDNPNDDADLRVLELQRELVNAKGGENAKGKRRKTEGVIVLCFG